MLLAISPSVQARDAVSAAEVNGTFTDKFDSTFDILALGNNKLQVKFSGIYPYKTPQGEATANMGEASGTADIHGDTAVFKPEGFEKTCTITIEFTRPGQLKASQEGGSPDCGFGMHVRADGTYRKTSAIKPKRD
ncbi:MAG: hypothetical protein K8R69_08205 [Deltaproteobacteria bacterium]|nr:hypothetical protein [Deltaproteobacteria bacterium]